MNNSKSNVCRGLRLRSSSDSVSRPVISIAKRSVTTVSRRRTKPRRSPLSSLAHAGNSVCWRVSSATPCRLNSLSDSTVASDPTTEYDPLAVSALSGNRSTARVVLDDHPESRTPRQLPGRPRACSRSKSPYRKCKGGGSSLSPRSWATSRGPPGRWAPTDPPTTAGSRSSSATA